MLKPKDFKHFSTYLIAEEAIRRGIKVKKVFTDGVYADGSVLELRLDNKIEYIVGQRTSKIDVIAYWLQKNKYYAKFFLKKAGLSVSQGEIFRSEEVDKILSYANKTGYPVVAKKIDGTHGSHVHVNIENDAGLLNVLSGFPSGKILIEKMFVGTEYRLFATKKRFVAATNRIPANVIGDGVNSIKALVYKKNQDPRRSDGYSTALKTILLNDEVDMVLAKQKLTTSSVPKAGERIYLRENSNISTGGDSIDVTDLVHEDIKKIAIKTINAIPGLAYGGVDLLTNIDISKKPTKNSYIIIEINDSPMISMHHFPYEGKPRNAAAAIVDTIFPGTKLK